LTWLAGFLSGSQERSDRQDFGSSKETMAAIGPLKYQLDGHVGSVDLAIL
jgi:hypothetical protein